MFVVISEVSVHGIIVNYFSATVYIVWHKMLELKSTNGQNASHSCWDPQNICVRTSWCFCTFSSHLGLLTTMEMVSCVLSSILPLPSTTHVIEPTIGHAGQPPPFDLRYINLAASTCLEEIRKVSMSCWDVVVSPLGNLGNVPIGRPLVLVMCAYTHTCVSSWKLNRA